MAKKISITIIGILLLLFTFWLGRMSDASTQVAASQVPAPKPQKQIRVDTSFPFRLWTAMERK